MRSPSSLAPIAWTLVRLVLRVLLSLAYFLVVTPIAVVRRLVAGEPLRHRPGDMGFWIRHRPRRSDAELLKPS